MSVLGVCTNDRRWRAPDKSMRCRDRLTCDSRRYLRREIPVIYRIQCEWRDWRVLGDKRAGFRRASQAASVCRSGLFPRGMNIAREFGTDPLVTPLDRAVRRYRETAAQNASRWMARAQWTGNDGVVVCVPIPLMFGGGDLHYRWRNNPHPWRFGRAARRPIESVRARCRCRGNKQMNPALAPTRQRISRPLLLFRPAPVARTSLSRAPPIADRVLARCSPACRYSLEAA